MNLGTSVQQKGQRLMIIKYQKKNMSKEEMEAELKKTKKTNAEKTGGDKR